jgi:hypothetical protein
MSRVEESERQVKDFGPEELVAFREPCSRKKTAD